MDTIQIDSAAATSKLSCYEAALFYRHNRRPVVTLTQCCAPHQVERSSRLATNAVIAITAAFLMAGVLTGCGAQKSSSADTVPLGGQFVTPPPGGVPTVSGPTPASAAVTRLVPFTDSQTGISGVAPSSWQMFSGKNAFQISTAPTAPDGFIGMVVPADHPQLISDTFRLPRAPSTIPDAAKLLMEYLKTNQVDGPPPQVSEEQMSEDGSGRLIATSLRKAQGSPQGLPIVAVARTTVVPRGLLVGAALVPASQYPAESELVQQMVDSLRAL